MPGSSTAKDNKTQKGKTMKFFDLFKRKKETQTPQEQPQPSPQKAAVQTTKEVEPTEKAEPSDYIDDITFIQEIRHLSTGPWQQYDILLAASPYGWAYMLDSAQYLAHADLEGISEVQIGDLYQQKTNVTQAFRNSGMNCAQVPEMQHECGMLSVAGISKTLHAPTKIVWINQTRTMRLFTLLDDTEMIAKYVETVIRRSFGTENAMKRGKPIPQKPKNP